MTQVAAVDEDGGRFGLAGDYGISGGGHAAIGAAHFIKAAGVDGSGQTDAGPGVGGAFRVFRVAGLSSLFFRKIGCNSLCGSLANTIKVQADQDGIRFAGGDSGALFHRQKTVVGSGEDGFDAPFSQLALESLRRIQRVGRFFSMGADCTGIVTPMTGVNHHGSHLPESFDVGRPDDRIEHERQIVARNQGAVPGRQCGMFEEKPHVVHEYFVGAGSGLDDHGIGPQEEVC